MPRPKRPALGDLVKVAQQALQEEDSTAQLIAGLAAAAEKPNASASEEQWQVLAVAKFGFKASTV